MDLNGNHAKRSHVDPRSPLHTRCPAKREIYWRVIDSSPESSRPSFESIDSATDNESCRLWSNTRLLMVLSLFPLTGKL